MRDLGSIPWVGKIHWKGKWQPTPVFLPEKAQGQRNLMSYMGLKRVGHDLVTRITTYHIKECFSITKIIHCNSVQFSLVAQSCRTLCDPMSHSMPGLPVHHQLPESTQTHVHSVSDAIQPSHPLLSPPLPAPNPSQ